MQRFLLRRFPNLTCARSIIVRAALIKYSAIGKDSANKITVAIFSFRVIR